MYISQFSFMVSNFVSVSDLHSYSSKWTFNYKLVSLLIYTITLFPQFKKFYKSLSPNIEDFLAHNHMGIVTKLAEGCVKHGTKQQKFIQVSINI